MGLPVHSGPRENARRRPSPRLLALLLGWGALMVASPLDGQKQGSFPPTSRIVWLGDSITHQGLYSRFVEDFFFSRYPLRKQLFVNCGVNGDRSADALARLDLDVAPWKPTKVFVCLGMNDGAFSRDGIKALPEFQRNIRGILGGIRGLGAQAILLSPPPVDPHVFLRFGSPPPVEETLRGYNLVLKRFGSWLQTEAAKRKIPFVDLHNPLLQYQKRLKFRNPAESLSPDGIHPGNVGSALIAITILKSLGEQKPRLSVGIQGNRPEIEGGRLRGLVRTSDGFQFQLRADALPWVLPEEARGAAVLEAGYLLFNRFLLQAKDLPPGDYELRVDGMALLTATAKEWAKGVDLALETDHPDWIQAEQCVAWNAERGGLVRTGIRDIWEARRMLARSKQKGQSNSPDHRAIQERLKALEKNVGKVGVRLKELEARIQNGNKPRWHAYSLHRLSFPQEPKKREP
ncbi:MAG TPA: hypothetical protein ENK02_04925 [Planctomycetes bacterium]|nr:hypothetical protein [Planctomycetota bacterium]